MIALRRMSLRFAQNGRYKPRLPVSAQEKGGRMLVMTIQGIHGLGLANGLALVIGLLVVVFLLKYLSN